MRLDQVLASQQQITRSQAESWIRLGRVRVNGYAVTKTGYDVRSSDLVELEAPERYVSRAGLKLASVAKKIGIDFRGKTVLDVGSSTGGFTDFALQNGATRVIAVDVGTDQMHRSLRQDKRVELHEKTDIRDFTPNSTPDIVVIDVSFISLRQILPYLVNISDSKTQIVAMAKPQFEAQKYQLTSGVVKNNAIRRQILHDLEEWFRNYFVILNKSDSEIAGEKGNVERFYKLQPILSIARKRLE